MLNIANMRTKHARQTLEALRERFGDAVCRTVIRQSIAYAESAERAIPILDYRPDRGADYLSLAGELLRRLSRPDLLEQPRRAQRPSSCRPAPLAPDGAQSSGTSAPSGVNGTRCTSAQPSAAAVAASTTLPVSCQ